jgi:hypothetical protein
MAKNPKIWSVFSHLDIIINRSGLRAMSSHHLGRKERIPFEIFRADIIPPIQNTARFGFMRIFA